MSVGNNTNGKKEKDLDRNDDFGIVTNFSALSLYELTHVEGSLRQNINCHPTTSLRCDRRNNKYTKKL